MEEPMTLHIIILYLASVFGATPPEALPSDRVVTEIITHAFGDAVGEQDDSSSSSSTLPYPQVPLGWRRVTLEWDDGWWHLDFVDRTRR